MAEQVRDCRRLNDAEIRRALEGIADLSLLEEQLLFRLIVLSLARGYAWIGQAPLAALLRTCERTLRAAIQAMRARGLLRTARTVRGLRYEPEWDALGLVPAAAAAPDRQPVPMHGGSTTRSRRSTSSFGGSSHPAPEQAQQQTGAPPSADGTPAAADSAHTESALGAVLDRFGPEAARDVRAVLRCDRRVRSDPSTGQRALERLLRMTPDDIQRSVGACFRSFVTLASEGRLSPAPELPRELESPPEPERPTALARQHRHVLALRALAADAHERGELFLKGKLDAEIDRAILVLRRLVAQAHADPAHRAHASNDTC